MTYSHRETGIANANLRPRHNGLTGRVTHYPRFPLAGGYFLARFNVSETFWSAICNSSSLRRSVILVPKFVCECREIKGLGRFHYRLAFLAEQADNVIGQSALRLTPRVGWPRLLFPQKPGHCLG